MFTTQGWFYWAIFSALFAALTAIFAKIGLESIDSDYATLIRTFVIMLFLSVYVFLSSKWVNPFKLNHKSLLFLLLSGLATGASWLCYFRALKLGEASKVAPIDKMSLILVALFAVIFLGERPSVKNWAGIVLVAAGVIVIGLKK